MTDDEDRRLQRAVEISEYVLLASYVLVLVGLAYVVVKLWLAWH